MIRAQINTPPHPYDALIENGLLRSAGVYLRDVLPNTRRIFTITVARVRRHYGKMLTAAMDDAGLENHFLEMPDGEQWKTLKTVEDLALKMVRHGADRESAVVALGGGVVGDVTGFLGSIYMRGIKMVQAPTTFLAQVDASIGGKTGVNLASGKNLVGTFKQPRLVLIDPTLLMTLPEREFRAGLFEALKTGVIRNPRIFEFMEENRERILERDPVSLEWLISESVRVKASVVTEDELEKNVRMVLNFGHTVGHALETETHYRHFLHGEAVAWGMIAAASIAVKMGKTDEATAKRVIDLVRSYGPLPPVKVIPRNIIKRLTRDKKTIHGKVHFILPTALGQVEVHSDVPERVLIHAIEELKLLSHA